MVRPLDRPCDDEEPAPPVGSGLCAAAGAVLCVVGVVCGVDAEPLDAPGAVLCVVGVVCTLEAVPCGVGVEECAGWDAVPVDCVLWLEAAPEDGELPRSA
ncbi:MAG TPA: hypothetical protein VJS67_01535 [Pseudonocardiaceae bacterium]|nr:hypothetical protein [Pseudonocardiaceae bacterium]